MKAPTPFTTFTNRYPLVGPLLWVTTVQYYLVQVIVASAWPTHYNLLHNTISDLGNTECGVYMGRFVCSPLFMVMNISFVMLGITMGAGSLLVYREFRPSWRAAVGFSFMLLAGFGAFLVGTFPENLMTPFHGLGGALSFLIGNIGLIVLGLVLALPKKFKVYTITSGIVALIALALFLTHNYLGLGIGGMERLTAYPQTMWLIIFGLYISNNHMQTRLRAMRRRVHQSSSNQP